MLATLHVVDHQLCVPEMDAAPVDSNSPGTNFCGQSCRKVLQLIPWFFIIYLPFTFNVILLKLLFVMIKLLANV